MHAHDLDLAPTARPAMRSLPSRMECPGRNAPALAANRNMGLAPCDPLWFRMPPTSKQPEAHHLR